MENFIVEYISSPVSFTEDSVDLNTLEKPELIQKIQELTQENQRLQRRLKELEEYSDISEKERLNSMGQELEALRTKLNEKNQSISASTLEAMKLYELHPTSSTTGSVSPKTEEKEEKEEKEQEEKSVVPEEGFQTSPKSTSEQGRISSTTSTKSPSMVLMQQDAQYYAKMVNREGARQSAESRVWNKEILVAIKNKEPREKILGQIQHVIQDFIPKKARGAVWPILIGNPLRIKRCIYDQLCRSMEACPVSDKVKNQIKEDLVRTYPELKSFNRGGALNDDLQHLLELFHFARPDIGYVQGISYPASLLLLHMDNYHAFKCLMNLIVCRPFLAKLYKFEFDEIRLMCTVFEQLLKQRSPLVQKHLERMNITSEVFLIEWLVTLFCRNFHIDWTCKIWDLFLFEGEVALIKVALKILQMVESELVRRDYAETLYYIRGCTNKIDMEKLFRNVQNCQLTKDKLHKLMEKERKKKTEGVKNIFGSLFPKHII